MYLAATIKTNFAVKRRVAGQNNSYKIMHPGVNNLIYDTLISFFSIIGCGIQWFDNAATGKAVRG
jgi:hypothetical protein